MGEACWHRRAAPWQTVEATSLVFPLPPSARSALQPPAPLGAHPGNSWGSGLWPEAEKQVSRVTVP